MSDVVRSIVLGIIQGLTEFLPVSSSGHLEIVNHLLGSNESIDSDLLMVILVHLGTAFSIIYVYRKDILRILNKLFSFKEESEGWMAWKIAVSMVPAAVVGIFFNNQLEALFEGSIMPVGYCLIVTGIVLYFTPSVSAKFQSLSFFKAGIIGMAQAFAILPGISRSGMTIAAALYMKIDRAEAARFSFLMVLPLIIGKVILDLMTGELLIDRANWLPILAALISSFLVGIWACKWMVRLVQNSQIHHFAYYCFFIGAATLILAYYGS